MTEILSLSLLYGCNENMSIKNKKIRCDIYTRVSTTMQVDVYSLDAQKEKLKRYAEFQRMLNNIENGTDEVQFVLVFKLSRFGRNAADVLNSLQRMKRKLFV